MKTGIEEEYNDFKNITHIKELFKERKLYDIEVSKRKEDYKFKLEDVNVNKNIVSPAEIGPEFDSLIQNYNDTETIMKLKNVLMNRLYYLANSIKRTVKDVIEKSQITNIYSGLLESSCCTENADQYINYYLI